MEKGKKEEIVSTHMPLARHDYCSYLSPNILYVSTHMPLARHDEDTATIKQDTEVSTHMPLARHDHNIMVADVRHHGFYSHASCEA